MEISTSPHEVAALQATARALDFELSSVRARRLLAYLDLLMKWSRVYNLTAVRDRNDVITKHLADSLSAIEPIQRETGDQPFRLLDVGAGAGLPGVVVAAVLDRADVTCVDAAGKKAGFVRQVAGELKLRNLRSEHSRIEELRAAPFDLVTARAFGSLSELVSLTDRHLARAGRWMAMKGREPKEEVATLPEGIEVFHVEQRRVPGLQAERCLMWMKRRQTD